jgi:signal peptide peptidase SppA
MGKIDRVLAAVYGSLWAIEMEKFEAITEFLDLRAAGGQLTAEEISARVGARPAPVPSAGGVAVLPLFGVVGHRMGSMSEMSGGTSTEAFAQDFDAAVANPRVSRIVIDVNSPGGAVAGVDELSQRIYDARSEKPSTAVANSTAASAAYWIGSAASEFVVIPSGRVGSIGVFGVHTDRSEADAQAGIRRTIVKAGKYKAEDTPYAPLSEEAHAAMQDEVSEVYGTFVDAVARNRGVTAQRVREGFGEGRTVSARRALAEGMVDRIATLEEVLGQTSAALAGGRSRARAAELRTRLAAHRQGAW